MPNFQAVSKAAYANKRWKRYSSYTFAANDAVAPLVAHELPRAMMHLPIGFMKQQDVFVPVAVLGLQPGQNLFVAPDGRWIGGYTPAAYRGYPFQLATSAEGQSVLVIDDGSGLITDMQDEGEAFFDDEGNPAKPVKDVLDFLGQVQANRAATERTCAVLGEHQLIQPWPITVQGASGERKVEGLYRIDEAALNAAPASVFEALNRVGALPVAYCQLLSMQHLQTLGKLAHAHQQAAQPVLTTASGDLDLEFLNNGGTISFGPH